MTDASRPMYVQIAEKLHNRGKDPAGTDPLPSVRKVASQFGVSSVTASRALQIFRLKIAQQLGNTPEPKKSCENWAVCLHVTPGPYQHAAAQLTANGFRNLALDGQVTFDFDSLRIGEDDDVTRINAHVASAVERGAQGIFLLPSRINDKAMQVDEAILQASALAGVPVVLLERNLRGEDRPLSLDLVSFHDFEGGRLLTRHLAELGRKRIAFLTGSPTSSHLERLAGYLSALRSSGLKELLVIENAPRPTSGSAYTDLTAQLIDWQADSVICYHEYAAVGVIMELLRRGMTVPDKVAVAAFYDLGLGESFSIDTTTYSFPAKTVAERALDVMRWRIKSPQSPPIKLVVPGELIIRGSTAANGLLKS